MVELRVPRRHDLRRAALVDDHAGLVPERLGVLRPELDDVVLRGHVVAPGRRKHRGVDVARRENGDYVLVRKKSPLRYDWIGHLPIITKGGTHYSYSRFYHKGFKH